jgi:hypothetical protein
MVPLIAIAALLALATAGCSAMRPHQPRPATKLKIAARLLAATSIVGLAVAPAAHASTGPYASNRLGHTSECWGSNRGDYDAFHTAIPQAHCVRTYYDTTDVFPDQWPAKAGSAWVLLSIRPSYSALTNGSLDARISGLCSSAPPHSMITIDHENAGGNPLGYPPSIHNAAHYVAMQKRMEHLCAGTHARFGVIIIAPFSRVLKWIYRGDDWFGYDFYAFPRYLHKDGTINVSAVQTRMTNNLTTLRRFTGRRYPLIELGETNAGKGFQRKTWFATIASWFDTHDGHRGGWILTRWVGKGVTSSGLCGPWPPAPGVVRELRHLAWEHQ